MKHAFMTSPQRTTWAWLRDVWERADRSGAYESGWTFDHLYSWPEPTTDDCMEGWVVLTALLRATERLRGGVLVSGMIYRHPGVLANMASTLDIISGGRLELGVGAGSQPAECEAFGIETGSVRERFDRFEEGLVVLESLLTNERTTFTGEYYALKDAMNNPKPLQRPLPITIGGTGRRRTLRMAARYADHWNYTGGDPAEFRELRPILQKACADFGRDPGDIRCSGLLRYSGDSGELRAGLAAFEDAGADLVIISVPQGEAPDVIERIAELTTADR